MERFTNFFRSFGAGRLMVILGAALGVAATLAFTVFHFGSQPMALLWSDLPTKEVAQITARLDQAGVKYRLEANGTTVLVQADKANEMRMTLSGAGLPTSGSVGFEIFDSVSPLGQTDFMNQVQMKRALEGTLERNIKVLQGVTEARVLLSIPERRAFQETAEEPTASVIVGYTRPPEAWQVTAIQNLVAAATNKLKPSRVTVTDQSGKTLAGGDSGAANAQMMAQEMETSLEQAVRRVVEPVVGVGNMRVAVRAEVDKTQTTTRDHRMDPDAAVPVSVSSGTNTSRNGAGNGGAASADGNVPGGAGASAGGDSSATQGSNEMTNYENTYTDTTKVLEPGKINRLTVSVVLNGVTAADGAAPKAGEYSADQIAQIDELVKAAVGYTNVEGADPALRHDIVTVKSMPFNAAASPGADLKAGKTGFLSGMEKTDFMRIGEMAVLFVVALLTIFFVARPLIKGVGTGGNGMMPMPMFAGAGGGDAQVLASASGPMSAQLSYDPAGTPTGAAIAAAQAGNPSIDIARIEGQVKVSAVKQVSEFVERHPDESVSILRSWLHEA